MPLFDVPGWSIPNTGPSPPKSNKRKRPSSSSSTKLQSAEMNLDKLMHKLRGDDTNTSTHKPSKKRKRSGTDATFAAENHGEASTSRAGPSTPPAPRKDKDKKRKKQERPSPSMISGPKKLLGKKERETRERERRERAAASSASLATTSKTLTPSSMLSLGSFTFMSKSPKKTELDADDRAAGLTPLQKGMKSNLEGARFRWINEALYKADSATAHQMMRDDPKVYAEYHTGFRHQVQSWPSNPVAHYAAALASYPPRTAVADLGAGDAALARALSPAGLAVFSFDLVADGAFVVEADVCARVPLPGSEGAPPEGGAQGKGAGEAAAMDVVVCALSLMGTNWVGCVREAWRILRPGGELKIAEVASRFVDVDEFVALVGAVGFKLESKDDSNTHFTLFEFRKVARKWRSEAEWAGVVARGEVLKPCEYKRR